MARPRELPDRARVVIIGGGVGGASIAYHLAQLGERDVVLLDRNELTSGSTFHSAGLVGQLRGSVSLTRMMMDSVALYRQLDCGWVECGGIRLACTPGARAGGACARWRGPRPSGCRWSCCRADEAQELFPLMVTEGVRCASYLPTDGYLDPSLLTYALTEGARAGGCRVFTHTRVHEIVVAEGRVRGVRTEWGDIEAEVVVNAGGMYAAQVGRLAGIRVPVIPFAHEYLVTQPFRERGVGGDIVHLPTLRDPDLLVYFREEGAGLLMGGYERQSALVPGRARVSTGSPADFNGRLLEEDWPRFEEIAGNSAKRVPAMEDVKVTRLINGPEAFTPDNEFCLGETDVRGLFVAAGFCAHGLAGAGGIGKVMAEWIVAGEPSLDVWEMDIRRFGPQYRSPRLHAGAGPGGLRDLLRHPLPRARAPGRPAAAHLERLRLAPRPRRGVRREVGLGAGQLVRLQRARGRRVAAPPGVGRPHWSPAIGAEHRATRTAAGLFDESSFAKLEVSGPGAGRLLERLCDNHVAARRRARSPTPRCSTAAAGSSATSPSPGSGRDLPDRHRDRVRQPRRRLDPPPPARTTAR